MLVKPAPGRAIRDPGTMQLVPDEGLEVDATAPFWARALLDKDVVETRASKATGIKPEPPAPHVPVKADPPIPVSADTHREA